MTLNLKLDNILVLEAVHYSTVTSWYNSIVHLVINWPIFMPVLFFAEEMKRRREFYEKNQTEGKWKECLKKQIRAERLTVDTGISEKLSELTVWFFLNIVLRSMTDILFSIFHIIGTWTLTLINCFKSTAYVKVSMACWVLSKYRWFFPCIYTWCLPPPTPSDIDVDSGHCANQDHEISIRTPLHKPPYFYWLKRNVHVVLYPGILASDSGPFGILL